MGAEHVELESLLACVYDAALVPSRWEEALRRLQTLYQARGTQATYWRMSDKHNSWSKWAGMSDADMILLDQYSALINEDPRSEGMPRTLVEPQRIESLCDKGVLHRSRMYREVLAPLNAEHGVIFSVTINPETLFTTAVLLGREMPLIGDVALHRFATLVPHFSRAAIMHHRLMTAERKLGLAQALLDAIPLGLFALEGGEIAMANRSGRALAQQGHGITIRGNQLQALVDSDRRALSRAVEQVRDVGDVVGISLEGADGLGCTAVVTPLHADAPRAMGINAAAIAVYLSDPKREMATQEDALRAIFKLTRAEARVLKLLMQGLDAAATAKALGNSVETVRTHIRRLLEKTGALSQTDMMRIALQSAAAFI